MRRFASSPSSIPAYINLADVYRLLGRDAEGERILRAGLSRAPQQRQRSTTRSGSC